MGDDIVLEVPLDKQLSEIIKMVQDVLRQRFTPEGADEPDYGEHGNPMHVTRLDIVLPVYLAKGKEMIGTSRNLSGPCRCGASG